MTAGGGVGTWGLQVTFLCTLRDCHGQDGVVHIPWDARCQCRSPATGDAWQPSLSPQGIPWMGQQCLNTEVCPHIAAALVFCCSRFHALSPEGLCKLLLVNTSMHIRQILAWSLAGETHAPHPASSHLQSRLDQHSSLLTYELTKGADLTCPQIKLFCCCSSSHGLMQLV